MATEELNNSILFISHPPGSPSLLLFRRVSGFQRCFSVFLVLFVFVARHFLPPDIVELLAFLV